MREAGFNLLRNAELKREQKKYVDRFFHERALPILTPMACDPAHPSPRYHNRGLYLGTMLEHEKGLGPKQLFAVVQVPQVFAESNCVARGQCRQCFLRALGRISSSKAAGAFWWIFCQVMDNF